MNYDGHEGLRRDIAGLANSMCDLKTTLNVLEERYHWQHDGLPERSGWRKPAPYPRPDGRGFQYRPVA